MNAFTLPNQDNAFQRGAFGVASESVTPDPPAAPSVAPVLDAFSIGAGESFALFAWSYSGGDEGTEGFGFEIWVNDELLTTTLLNPYSTSFSDGSYTAKVRAVNVSGAGPFSNSEGFTVPGPGEPETLLLNSGEGLLLNSGELLQLNG